MINVMSRYIEYLRNFRESYTLLENLSSPTPKRAYYRSLGLFGRPGLNKLGSTNLEFKKSLSKGKLA
jgi:hypothetical protein